MPVGPPNVLGARQLVAKMACPLVGDRSAEASHWLTAAPRPTEAPRPTGAPPPTEAPRPTAAPP